MSEELNALLDFPEGGDAPAETVEASTPTEVEAAPSPTPEANQTTTHTASPWDEPDDNEALPPSLRGKPRKEVYEANLRAVAEAHQAGFQKNQAEARAQAAELFAETLRKKYEEFAQPQPVERPPQTEEEALQRYIDQRAEERARSIVQQELRPIQQEALSNASERAIESGYRLLKAENVPIPEDVYGELRPQLAAIMFARKWDSRDPLAWAEAAKLYIAPAAKMFPQQVVQQTPGSPIGNGKPAAVSAAPKPKVSTGDKRVDKELNEMIDLWNRKSATKVTFDDVAGSIATARSMGVE